MLTSYQKQHKAVTTGTLSRWLKEILKHSDIEKFTRRASSSAAKRFNVNITTILQVASLANSWTFSMFYNKPLQTDNNFDQVL